MLKIKNNILLVIALMVCTLGSAQKYNQDLDDFSPEATKRDKLGIRVGVAISTLRSPDLVNTRFSRGYQGAFYYRVNLFKGFHLNPEFGASIRGSQHNNGDEGYSQISLFYFDFGVLGFAQIDKNYNHNLVFGAQASRLMRSSLFIGKEQFASFLQLPFKPLNVDAVLGYHFNLQYAGFQVCLKYGLTNIAGDFYNFSRVSVNSNLQFGDIKPSLRNVTDIRNLSVELSVYF